MKSLSVKLLISLCISLLINPAVSAYLLPKNPQTAVLIYHSLSGEASLEKTPPLLTVYADGRIIAGSPSGLEKTIESTLSAEQLQQFLSQLIAKNHFFEIDAGAIQQQVKTAAEKKGKLFKLMDANTVNIQLQLQDLQKTQRFYSLATAAEQYPDIKPLQDLAAIEVQLQKMRHWLMIGKDEGLIKELAVANQKLKQESPQTQPLNKDDLEMVALNQNGERSIHFQRQHRDTQHNVIGYISVYNHYDRQGKLTVTVTAHGN